MIIKPSLVAIVILIIVAISLNVIYYIVTLRFTKSKLNLLDVRTSDKSQDIICLTEVLPKHCYIIPNAESCQIKDYNMIIHNFNNICICSKPPIFITVLDHTYEFQEYNYIVLSFSV